MPVSEEKFIEELIRLGFVKQENMKTAIKEAKANKSTITDYLLSKRLITKEQLGQAIANLFGVHYLEFSNRDVSQEQEKKIPEKIAQQYRIALFAEDDKTAVIVTDNPEQKGLADALKSIYKDKKIEIAFSFPEDIETSLVRSKKSLETKFGKIIASNIRVAPEIVTLMIEDALAHKASDIHLEPEEKEVIVRFRIDGVLYEVGRIPGVTYENILNRIKVMSHLRVDEHFSAQDGSMRYHRDEGSFDIRVSIVPTIDGETVVMRMLAVYVPNLSLADLGISPQDQETFMKAASKPFGMILAVGPTGSGKTTTLYALLKTFNRSEINLTTIEDPVEYKITGANQIQVNLQTNLTFAKGLRSIVRQDPDIIFVGEIRDRETAEIAVNAALTGHLLFSTFHANDAATGIPRLLDMGIEPFLLASTLQVVAAQRLVRKICNSCREQISISAAGLEKTFPNVNNYFPEQKIVLHRGKGCKTCGNKGYQGRTAIFEFIQNTPELQALILSNPSTQEIWELARKQGSKSLFEDGVDKVKQGITSLEELLRVALPPERNEQQRQSQNKESSEPAEAPGK